MTEDELRAKRKKAGEELGAKRNKAGLSVTQAARLVHVADRTWQRYEHGDIMPPGAIVELFEIKTRANR